MTCSIEPPINGKEFTVLDPAGCLTIEAMCFTEQLGLHHQAVVERHIKACTICAQQLADMARVANSFRQGKPRVPVPSEIKLLSRQLALRSVALKAPTPARPAKEPTAAAPARPRTGKRSPSIRRPWYRSHALQMALIGGLGATLAMLLLALLLSGCKSPPEGGRAPASASVKITASRTLVSLGAEIAAVAADPGGLLAAGSIKGQVVLILPSASGAARVTPLEAFTPKGDAPDAGPPQKRLLHPGGVAALAFSRDGNKLVSVGGKNAALWDVKKRALVVDVGGPQNITSVIPGAQDNAVFFATDQGHVLRWDLAKKVPDAVPDFFCGASTVPSARLRLPASRRCMYGVYQRSQKGVHVCLYPVTELMLHGDLLVRACRSGNMGMLNLKTRKTSYYMSGYVRAMTSLGSELLLLARDDGQLRLYRPRTGKVDRTLKMKGKPEVAVASVKLIAVSRLDGILIWSADGGKALAAIKTPSPTVWMRLQGDELQVMMKSGEMVGHKLALGK